MWKRSVPAYVLPPSRASARAPYSRVVERSGRYAAPIRAVDGTRADNPAIRDAAQIVARAAADEAAADQAREEYRTRAMPALEPDAGIAPLLGPDEHVLAVRRCAMFDRRQPRPGSDAPAELAGDLYVTSRRLVLVGRLTLAIELAEIEDAVLSGERLLLVMRDGRGASLDVARPRLLRVEIATARALARS
jgi:hypothetical protein